MLILLNQRNDLTKLYAVRSVVFLGTPAQGSGFAALLNIFSKNPQFGDMEPADVNTYIQALDHDWQTLLRRRAAEGASYPLAYCAFENLPVFPWLPWSTIVKFSESQSFCDEYPVGFDRDHIELVKPGDTSTEPYQWVKARILEAAEKPGLFNQKVVIMDGSHRCIVYDNQTYDEGATNGDDIADILQKIPVRTIKEHVHSTWQRETAILAQNPALIIIHYSAFYRQTNPADSQGRFQTFIKAMERNNPKIKYLVYTRASKEGLPEKYKKIKEEIKEDFRRKGPPKRLDWWDITQGHEFNKIRSEYNTACFEHESEFRKEGEERPSFRNSNTRRELLKRVKKLLDL